MPIHSEALTRSNESQSTEIIKHFGSLVLCQSTTLR